MPDIDAGESSAPCADARVAPVGPAGPRTCSSAWSKCTPSSTPRSRRPTPSLLRSPLRCGQRPPRRGGFPTQVAATKPGAVQSETTDHTSLDQAPGTRCPHTPSRCRHDHVDRPAVHITPSAQEARRAVLRALAAIDTWLLQALSYRRCVATPQERFRAQRRAALETRHDQWHMDRGVPHSARSRSGAIVRCQDVLVTGQPLLDRAVPPVRRDSIAARTQAFHTGPRIFDRQSQPARPRPGLIRQRAQAPVAVVLGTLVRHCPNVHAT